MVKLIGLPNAMWSLTLFVELYFYLFQLENHQLHQCKVQECLVCKLEVSIFTVEEFGVHYWTVRSPFDLCVWRVLVISYTL